MTFPPKFYVNSIFSIYFPRRLDIRKQVFIFEEALKNKYITPPAMTPIPDELDAAVPRFIFNSQKGHSNISVSQIALSLSVNYDEAFTTDYDKCETYLRERVELLLPVVTGVTGGGLCYCGLRNTVQFLDRGITRDREFMQFMAEKFLSPKNYDNDLYDLSIKYAFARNDNFINFAISNVRNFIIPPGVSHPAPLAFKTAQSCGIQVVLDVNDRRAFNEKSGYRSSSPAINQVFAINKKVLEGELDAVLSSGKVIL